MKVFAISVVAAVLAGSASAVTLFQIDDFSAGTAGWAEGAPSPNPPEVVDTGLAGGPYLSNASSTNAAAGSRQVMWNDGQWTGDFVGAGVVGISFDALSTGGDPIDFRFAFNGPGGWFFTPKIRIDDFVAGPELGSFFLPITEADLAHAGGGTGIYAATMSAVIRMEIISATDTPTVGNVDTVLRGDEIDSTLLVDNIRAIPEPGPAALCLFGLLLVAARRRRS